MFQKMYSKAVKCLQEELEGFFRRKAKEKHIEILDEEKMKKLSGALAKIIWVTVQYGAGDAFAGLISKKYERQLKDEGYRKIIKILRDFGVRLQEEGSYLSILVFVKNILEADWGDDKINIIMRQLDQYSVTGGKYYPDFLKECRS